MNAQAVTPADLRRKVHGLNVKHDVDPGDPGFLRLETWRNNHSNQYRVVGKHVTGDIVISRWLRGSDLLEELRQKDWKRVLQVCRGEVRKWQD